ncbi:MAG TPA: sigma factor-like helix-turn-helix DNA-binding protein [Thermoanaerobaculia bacterium]|nr:sigma factor-like helix-turn-helix DNA-binding protein [Thermoanaerobaculia bacterium]
MVDPDDLRISDETLLRRFLAGDAAAFDRLVRRHQSAVYRYARAVVPDGADPEEVLCDAFQAARRGAARFRDEPSARPWLLTLARNAAERRHPRQGRENDPMPLRELARAAGWHGRDGSVPPDVQGLETALSALAPEDREVLVLREREKLGTDEAARVTGLTEAAIRTRLHRARLRLLAKLTEGGAGGG